MIRDFKSMPLREVAVDAQAALGPCEWWRHTLGHGGINYHPLPARVVEGVKKVRPRLIRIFIQEHFNVYPDHGQFNWTRLDPYMDALAATGAKVVAAITIKPKPLYPTIDHAIWHPADVAEWQKVIYELVKRYSVDRPVVTYWEVGNETDIGENGGAPYLIPGPLEYAEYYQMAIRPILEAFPQAKVGGTAACWIDNEPLPGFINYCRETGTQLDFISWHLYNSNPERHALGVEKAKARLAGYPGKRPEMLVTEWSTQFELVPDAAAGRRHISVEDMAFDPRRAASVASSILAMLDAGLDWSFYYHIWDQAFYPDDFRSFFSDNGLALMVEHWNEVPHRFGLFGVGEEVRPQYFVYQMLNRLGDERIAARSEAPDIHALATRDGSALSVLLANFQLAQAQDQIAQIHFTNLEPGRKLLTVYRIDKTQRWSADDMELHPIERRELVTTAAHRCQVFLPADSVALVRLESLGA